jgi:hypothetical protein
LGQLSVCSIHTDLAPNGENIKFASRCNPNFPVKRFLNKDQILGRFDQAVETKVFLHTYTQQVFFNAKVKKISFLCYAA